MITVAEEKSVHTFLTVKNPSQSSTQTTTPSSAIGHAIGITKPNHASTTRYSAELAGGGFTASIPTTPAMTATMPESGSARPAATPTAGPNGLHGSVSIAQAAGSRNTFI